MRLTREGGALLDEATDPAAPPGADDADVTPISWRLVGVTDVECWRTADVDGADALAVIWRLIDMADASP